MVVCFILSMEDRSREKKEFRKYQNKLRVSSSVWNEAGSLEVGVIKAPLQTSVSLTQRDQEALQSVRTGKREVDAILILIVLSQRGYPGR